MTETTEAAEARDKGAVRRHVPALDGVRGVAIGGVMALHFVGDFARDVGFERVLGKIAGYGLWGVDLFFVLSGFLITGILSDTRQSPGYFRNFLARRTLRIFPLYYLVLFILLIVVPRTSLIASMPELTDTVDLQAWLWTYTANFYIAEQGSFTLPYVSHFWSLAIEEHFYLVWPWVIGFLSRAAAIRVCELLFVLSMLVRVGLHLSGENMVSLQVLTYCRLDTLCAGAWFALKAREPGGLDLVSVRRWFFASGVLLVLASVVLDEIHEVTLSLRFSVFAVAFGCLVYLSTQPRGLPQLVPLFRQSWLRALGKYSYGIYVYHGIIAAWMHRHYTLDHLRQLVPSHGLSMLLNAAIGTALSILISVASYELFEKRFLLLKRFFEYRREKPAVPVVPQPSGKLAD